MKPTLCRLLLLLITLSGSCFAQTSQKKHLLVIGEEKGYRHESVSHAMTTIEHLGKQTGLWETTLRTDTEALTKKKLEFNAKNLKDFDAVFFFTGGDLGMVPPIKTCLFSSCHSHVTSF